MANYVRVDPNIINIENIDQIGKFSKQIRMRFTHDGDWSEINFKSEKECTLYFDALWLAIESAHEKDTCSGKNSALGAKEPPMPDQTELGPYGKEELPIPTEAQKILGLDPKSYIIDLLNDHLSIIQLYVDADILRRKDSRVRTTADITKRLITSFGGNLKGMEWR